MKTRTALILVSIVMTAMVACTYVLWNEMRSESNYIIQAIEQH